MRLSQLLKVRDFKNAYKRYIKAFYYFLLRLVFRPNHPLNVNTKYIYTKIHNVYIADKLCRTKYLYFAFVILLSLNQYEMFDPLQFFPLFSMLRCRNTSGGDK